MNKFHHFCFLATLALSASTWAAPDAQSVLKDSDQARGGGLPGIVWEIRLKSRDGERVDEPQRLIVKAVGESSVADVVQAKTDAHPVTLGASETHT